MNTAVSALLFTWGEPQRRRRALVAFLLGSLLLHAFCFYVFQIVYPPAVALPPAPARVSVISPDDAESLALLRWAEAEDPALASVTERPREYQAVAVPKLEHIPSYAQHEPVLKSAPQAPPDLRIPSSAAVGRMPRARPGTPVLGATRRTIPFFSETAQALGPPILPDSTFHLSRPEAPENARFRVGIDESGAIRHCFLIDSSGDSALDEEARKFLLLCRFPPVVTTSHALRWSIVTMLWGNDFSPLPSHATAP